MKILIVHNHYRFRGGEDLCFEADTELLRNRGHQVVHYTRHNDDAGNRGAIREALDTLWSRRTYDEVTALIRGERPDVMHVHNTFPLVSPSVYDAAADTSVPVVQSLHNYRPFCVGAALLRNDRVCESCIGSTFGWQGVRHRCYRGSLTASTASAAVNARNRMRGTWKRKIARFVAFSTASRDLFVRAGFPASRIVLNPHFVSLDRTPREKRTDAFMFVGRLVPEKGVDRLLEAWKGFEGDWELRIAGEGPLEESVRKAAASDPRIRFYGVIPRTQMLDRLAESAALVFPSPWHETFGRVLVEAFALGLPVLASNLGGPLDIVDSPELGQLFDPTSTAAIRAAMTSFVADRSNHPAMRQAAYRAYLDKYTEDRNYARLIGTYRDAIASLGKAATAAGAIE